MTSNRSGFQTVASREPMPGVVRSVWFIDREVELPRQWRERLACGCESVVRLRTTAMTLKRYVYLADRPIRAFDPALHLMPKRRVCEKHPNRVGLPPQRDDEAMLVRRNVLEFAKKMARRLRSRAQDRRLPYP